MNPDTLLSPLISLSNENKLFNKCYELHLHTMPICFNGFNNFFCIMIYVIVVLCIESKQLVLIATAFVFTPKCFVVGENAFLSLYKNENGYLNY